MGLYYIDLDRGIISLPGISRNDPFTGTKNKRDHIVPLSSYLWKMLKELFDNQKSKPSPFVFPGTTGCKPMSRPRKSIQYISNVLGNHYSLHASRRTFASIANEVGLGFLNVKRLPNHAFEGGVTCGYVVPGFNPESQRKHLQIICDYILDRKSEYLGVQQKPSISQAEAFFKLRRYAVELGLDPELVLTHKKLEVVACPGQHLANVGDGQQRHI